MFDAAAQIPGPDENVADRVHKILEGAEALPRRRSGLTWPQAEGSIEGRK
jgi:hypothetical protein